MDNLEKYLALPAETNLDLDVLVWWKARDHDKPADPASGRPEGLPHLAKMARQFCSRDQLEICIVSISQRETDRTRVHS